MAGKKRDRKAEKQDAEKQDAKKQDRVRLPKRIGGVKLTKELRKAGGALLAQANSPIGRELIAAGLGMAASAARAAAQGDRPGAPAAVPKPAPPARALSPAPAGDRSARPAAAAGGADPHEMGVALGRLAQDLVGRLFERTPRG